MLLTPARPAQRDARTRSHRVPYVNPTFLTPRACMAKCHAFALVTGLSCVVEPAAAFIDRRPGTRRRPQMTDDTMTLSRRRLLQAGAATLGLSALPALAKAPMLGTQAPYFYRFKLGNAEATVVSDGTAAARRSDPGVPRPHQGGDGAPALRQFPAAGKCRAGAERPDRQYRRPSGAVRHRHGQPKDFGPTTGKLLDSMKRPASTQRTSMPW